MRKVRRNKHKKEERRAGEKFSADSNKCLQKLSTNIQINNEAFLGILMNQTAEIVDVPHPSVVYSAYSNEVHSTHVSESRTRNRAKTSTESERTREQKVSNLSK